MSEWISVNDEWPVEYQNVVLANSESITIGMRAETSFYQDCGRDSEEFHATHWMPLPPLPKEDKK